MHADARFGTTQVTPGCRCEMPTAGVQDTAQLGVSEARAAMVCLPCIQVPTPNATMVPIPPPVTFNMLLARENALWAHGFPAHLESMSSLLTETRQVELFLKLSFTPANEIALELTDFICTYPMMHT